VQTHVQDHMTMDHVFGDSLIEEWMGPQDQNLGRHYIINIPFGIPNFVLLLKENEESM